MLAKATAARQKPSYLSYLLLTLSLLKERVARHEPGEVPTVARHEPGEVLPGEVSTQSRRRR